LPVVRDAFCPFCRNAIDDEPVGGAVAKAVKPSAAAATSEALPRHNGNAEKTSADWGFGLLAGVLFGIALAMIFVEPYWITPESKARLYVAVGGIIGAAAVTVLRNWFRRKGRDGQPRMS
jgi:hypothetical protein